MKRQIEERQDDFELGEYASRFVENGNSQSMRTLTTGTPATTRLINRFQFIDAAKVLAIYFVVFYHSGLRLEQLLVRSADYTTYLRYLVFGVLTTGVPIFFTINGYLLLNRPLRFRPHVTKTLRLYFLTIIWSLITTSLLIPIEGDRYSSLTDFFHAVVFLKQGGNNHLWFLFTLISIYLFLPILKLAYDSQDKTPLLWLLALVFLFSFCTVLGDWCINVINWLLGHNPIVIDGEIRERRPFDTQRINPFGGYFWAVGYFIIGGLVGQRLYKRAQEIPSWSLFIILCFGLVTLWGYGLIVSPAFDGQMFDTVWYGYNSIPGLVMTISLFLLLLRLPRINGKMGVVVNSIGANTLGIYFLHVPLIKITSIFYKNLAVSKYMTANLGYAAAILCISWILALVFRRVPKLGGLVKM